VTDHRGATLGNPLKKAVRQRSISAHGVLLAHPWAAQLIMSRFNIGPGRILDGRESTLALN
jgi:hypothetical protein